MAHSSFVLASCPPKTLLTQIFLTEVDILKNAELKFGPILNFPKELFFKIFREMLPLQAMCRCNQVCKQWYVLTSEGQLWRECVHRKQQTEILQEQILSQSPDQYPSFLGPYLDATQLVCGSREKNPVGFDNHFVDLFTRSYDFKPWLNHFFVFSTKMMERRLKQFLRNAKLGEKHLFRSEFLTHSDMGVNIQFNKIKESSSTKKERLPSLGRIFISFCFVLEDLPTLEKAVYQWKTHTISRMGKIKWQLTYHPELPPTINKKVKKLIKKECTQ